MQSASVYSPIVRVGFLLWFVVWFPFLFLDDAICVVGECEFLQCSSIVDVAQSHSFFSSCFVGSGEFAVTLPGLGGSAAAPVGDVTSWKDEQLEQCAALPASDRDRLQPRPSDGVLLYVDNDEFGRCFVPESQRVKLVNLAHESLFHLGYVIVYAHLRRWYWWPGMRKSIQAQLAPCPTCQLAKRKRRLAHRMFRSNPLSTPRTQWGFDLKGVHPAANGHNEIGVAVDLSSHRLVLFSCAGRDASTLRALILSRVIHVYGVPLRWRTDHAQELIGRVMTQLFSSLGTVTSTTASYHPQGNASAERAMRFVNVCLTLLSDAQYALWPDFLSAFECAWNSHTVSSIGCSPFEADHGTPMLTPAAAMAMVGSDLSSDAAVDPLDVVAATRASAKAYGDYARANEAWAQHLRLRRLNASGSSHDFAVGDLVSVYVPPTAGEARRRKRTVKHMAWFRGPCKVISTDGSTFRVQRLADGKIYDRTLQNIAPWVQSASAPYISDELRTSAPLPPPLSPSRAPVSPSTDGFSVGAVLACKEKPATDKYWLVRELTRGHRGHRAFDSVSVYDSVDHCRALPPFRYSRVASPCLRTSRADLAVRHVSNAFFCQSGDAMFSFFESLDHSASSCMPQPAVEEDSGIFWQAILVVVSAMHLPHSNSTSHVRGASAVRPTRQCALGAYH